MDAIWLLERYIIEHNRLARGSASASPLLALFAPDACLDFGASSPGLLEGVASIGRAFRSSPPTDALVVRAIVMEGDDGARAEYRWESQSTRRAGTLLLQAADGYIARLTVSREGR